MASHLREALEEIASESHPTPPSTDLWRRGKARQRLRTAGLVAASVALLVSGGGVVLGLDAAGSAEPPAADVPDTELHLPDRVYKPSGWTKGARVVGPIAVAWSASRAGWGGSEHGIMTVSAVDGGYRFVDVPGLDRLEGMAGEWALSPGGRYVAWWQPSADRQVYDAVAAVRVYDAETGRVLAQVQPEVDGVPVARGELGWLDADTLVFSVAKVEKRSTGTSEGFTTSSQAAQVWDIADDAVRQTDVIRWSVHPPRLLEERLKRTWEVDPTTGQRTLFARTADEVLSPLFSPSADRFAGLGPSGTGPRDLVWGRVPAQGPPEARSTGLTGTQVVAWRSGHEVIVLVDGDSRRPAYELVDLDGGRVSTLVEVPYFGGDNLQIASDLAARPTAQGVEPRRVWDPRLPTGGGALLLLLVAAWFMRRWWVSRWS